MPHPPHLRRRRAAVCLAAAALGCTTVRLVSDYDETTDREVTAVQRMVDDTLDAIVREKAPKCLFDAHAGFYAAAHSALHSLVIRNRARGTKNRLTTEQLVAMDSESLPVLEQLHRLAAAQSPPACMDTSALRLDQQAFDQSFEAILKLELAKKRGN